MGLIKFKFFPLQPRQEMILVSFKCRHTLWGVLRSDPTPRDHDPESVSKPATKDGLNRSLIG